TLPPPSLPMDVHGPSVTLSSNSSIFCKSSCNMLPPLPMLDIADRFLVHAESFSYYCLSKPITEHFSYLQRWFLRHSSAAFSVLEYIHPVSLMLAPHRHVSIHCSVIRHPPGWCLLVKPIRYCSAWSSSGSYSPDRSWSV